MSFSVYDLNTGPGGECTEELILSDYDYYKTPLRPVSDNPISSSITFDSATDTFKGTLPSLSLPTDPNSLATAKPVKPSSSSTLRATALTRTSTSLAWAAPAGMLDILFAGSCRFARRRRRCRHAAAPRRKGSAAIGTTDPLGCGNLISGATVSSSCDYFIVDGAWTRGRPARSVRPGALATITCGNNLAVVPSLRAAWTRAGLG